MKATVASSLLILAAEATAAGVVQHKLHRKAGFVKTTVQSSSAGKDAVDTDLDFRNDWINQGGYFITLDIGTPPQSFELLVDTGSADLFVPGADADNCEIHLCAGGTFNPTDSSTYSVRTGAPQFHIEYMDGSIVDGEYATDDISVEGVKLSNVTFSVADEIQVSPWAVDINNRPIGPQYGIMGFNVLEGQSALDFTYTTVPLALKQQGYTNSWSYSLYMDDVESDNGQIIFGGVDTAKYHGELTTLEVDSSAYEQVVTGTGFSVTRDGQTTRLTDVPRFTALLDSGRAGWDIPASAYSQVADLFEDLNDAVTQYNSSLLLPCSYFNEDSSITVELTGENDASTSIEVPLGNLLIPALTSETTGNYNDTQPLILNGTEQCIWSLHSDPDDSTLFTFGDPFFRSAYLFFNLDDGTISVAQASYDAESSNVVPVGSGAGNSSSTLPTGSGNNATLPTFNGGGTGPSPTGGSSGTEGPAENSANTMQAVGVLSVLALAAAFVGL